jgi:hypothetical protein
MCRRKKSWLSQVKLKRKRRPASGVVFGKTSVAICAGCFSYQEYVDERMRRLIRTAISDVLHMQTNLMHSFNSRRVTQIFTLLLQIISAFTTYAGFVFFLGTVNPFAPIFMAVTVQGLAYYLMNNASSRKRAGGWKRIALLTLLIIISSTTSYIGYLKDFFDEGKLLAAGKAEIEKSASTTTETDPDIGEFIDALWTLSKLDDSSETNELISKLNVNHATDLHQYELPDFEFLVGQQSSEPKEAAAGQPLISRFLKWTDSVMGSLNQLVVSKDLTQAEEIRSVLNDAMQKNYDSLPKSIQSDAGIEDILKESQAENPQLMPFLC